METVCPWCGQPSDRGWLKNRTEHTFTEARQRVAVASAGPYASLQCTALQTDNHASTSPLSFYRPDALPAAQPTASKH